MAATEEGDKQPTPHQHREDDELIEGVAGVALSDCTQHLAATTMMNATASHRAQLACAGGALRHGITPDSTTGRLNQELAGLYTKLHAPLPPLFRPASPPSEIGDRAGSGSLAATLNENSLESPGQP